MSIINPSSLRILEDLLDNFLPYAKEQYGYEQTPTIRFAKDPDNAKNPLGKTGYYEPDHSRITIYIDGRHPKDIMRSISHELVHHAQNGRGDLAGTQGVGEQGYAQNNEHLREMEREAYERGNLCFRDWEDGIKSENPNMYESLKRNLKESQFAATASEEAQKINSQAGIHLNTDQAYWEKVGVRTGEELAIEILTGTYSDMFKSIHNVRPRRSFASVEEVEAAIDRLDGEMEAAVEQQKLDAQAEEEYRKNQELIASLMPDEYDVQYDKLPKQSGHGKGLREDMFTKRNRSLNERLMESFGYKLKEEPYVGEGEIPVSGGQVAAVGFKRGRYFWRHTNGLTNSYDNEGKFFMSLRDAGLGMSEANELLLQINDQQRQKAGGIQSGHDMNDEERRTMYDDESLSDYSGMMQEGYNRGKYRRGEDNYFDDYNDPYQKEVDNHWRQCVKDAEEHVTNGTVDQERMKHDEFYQMAVESEIGNRSRQDKGLNEMPMGGETGVEWSDLLAQIINYSPDPEAKRMAEEAYELVSVDTERATDLIADIMNNTSDADTSETADKAYDAVEALGMEKSQVNEDFQVGEFVYIIDGGLRGATGKIAEPTTLVTGEQGYVIHLYSDADKKVFGKQGDEVIAGVSKIRSGGTFDGSELYDIDEANEGGEGVHDIFNMPEPDAVEPTGNPKEDALRQILAQGQAAKVDGVMVDGYTASAIVQVLDAIRPDIKEKYLASPVHIMAKLAFGQMKENKLKEERGEYVTPGSPAPGPDAELIEKIAELMATDPEFRVLKPFVEKFKRYTKSGGAVESSLEAALPDYVAGKHVWGVMKKAKAELGRAEEPAQRQADPPIGGESDYVDENRIKEALKRAFKKNPALIEVAKKVDMKKLAERFRDSPEEKEMTSKMSNKEFSDYHTRDKHIVPDLKGDMGPIPGMEGPFQYASGAVLYYDNKAGKYYDRGRDMHLDDEEASRLTMESKLQIALKTKLSEVFAKHPQLAENKEFINNIKLGVKTLMENKDMKTRITEGVQDRIDDAAAGQEKEKGVADRAKEGGKKTDVIALLKHMFKSPETGNALAKIKGDQVEVAEFMGEMAKALGLDAAGLKQMSTRITGNMGERLAEGVVNNLKESGFDNLFDDPMDPTLDDDYEEEYGLGSSADDEDIEALLRQYGLDKGAASDEDAPADIQRQMDDEFGGVEDEEEEIPARRATVMKEDDGEYAHIGIKTTQDEYGALHILPGVQFTGDIAADVKQCQQNDELDSWLYGELGSDENITDAAGEIVYAGADVQDHVGAEEDYDGSYQPRMAEQSEDHDYEYRARKEKEDDEEDARRRGWEQEKQDAKRKADCDESFDRFHSNKRNTRLNETLMKWAIK